MTKRDQGIFYKSMCVYWDCRKVKEDYIFLRFMLHSRSSILRVNRSCPFLSLSFAVHFLGLLHHSLGSSVSCSRESNNSFTWWSRRDQLRISRLWSPSSFSYSLVVVYMRSRLVIRGIKRTIASCFWQKKRQWISCGIRLNYKFIFSNSGRTITTQIRQQWHT
jgi:hypothetical protein